MGEIGTIKVETETSTQSIPVFQVSDVSIPAWKVWTDGVTGALNLVDPANADTPIRIKTDSGIKGVKTTITVATEVSSDFTLNNQDLTLTVYEDTTGNGEADNREKVSLSSGTNTYSLDKIQGDSSNEYWIELHFENPDIEKSAEVREVTLNF